MIHRFLSTLTVGILTIVSSHAQPNPEAERFIDGVITNVKRLSVYSHRVIWDSVRADMLAHAGAAKSMSELQPAFMILFEALQDKQAKLTEVATGQTIAALADSKVAIENSSFEFRVLEGDINYLRLVGIPANADVQKEAEKIRAALDSLGKDESEKWVLDLRGCGGENANAIFAGIAPLLGEGQVCAEVDGKLRVRGLYEIHNGNFYNEKQHVAKFPYTNELHHQTIAVLIDNNTSQAGELIAVSLKGRKNARFFGKPTMGRIAGVTTLEISKGLKLTLSSCFYQDRKGNPYTSLVKPDVNVGEEEDTLGQAIQWLHANPGASIASSSLR
ncbi:MAG TPA: S41 family peptidase [Chryseosolibacter sp.]|nr:S41 family peptidase [Chryseosolibacter sp.]